MPYSPISGTDVSGQVSFSTTSTSTLPTGGGGYNMLRVQLSGTFSASLSVEVSENGATWLTNYGFNSDQNPTSALTSAGIYTFVISGYSAVRLNTSVTSGTMVVDYTLGRSSVITGGASTGTNTPFPIVSVVDKAGGIQPSGASAGFGIFTKITDGASVPKVQTASTVPVATDSALVVSLSPNSSDAVKGQISFSSVTTISIPILGQSYTIFRLQVSGTFSGVLLQPQVSMDGTNWNFLQSVSNSGSVGGAISASSTSVWYTYIMSGYNFLRINNVSFTSGTAVCDYTLTKGSIFNGGGTGSPFPLMSMTDVSGSVAAVSGSLVAVNPSTAALGVAVRPSNVVSYMATTVALAPSATATDIITITGSASKTVVVTKWTLSTVQTAAGSNTYIWLKRSSTDTAGTSTTATVVPLDSAFVAGTAVVTNYTANPTAGSLVGNLKSIKLFAGTGTVQQETYEWDMTNGGAIRGITLNGAAQQLCLNMNGSAAAGLNVYSTIEWYEY